FAFTVPTRSSHPFWIVAFSLTFEKVPQVTAFADSVVAPFFFAFGACATRLHAPSVTRPLSTARNAGRGVTSPMICSAPCHTTYRARGHGVRLAVASRGPML